MKTSKLIATAALLVAAFALSTATEAKPKKNSLKGAFWTVKTNIITQDHTLVRFYDANDQIMHEETLAGTHVELNKKSIRKLNKALKKFMKQQSNAQGNEATAGFTVDEYL